ncbi:hypothetical protein M408DRAFT_120865 [Serendipita vermifera MAFF 305830]|uniref:LIM zinc-binding domain-containing protein n=1 Tax=Serendipita vermifera MAFF 305830 TaxID=933852 RepID=A0A0C3BAU3_SERVB|nr:hypothetical protein M408DRAFT_120865 [Serendipita vermifera MAFF 305830]
MPPFGQLTICPRCSKNVYQAEQVLGPGRKIYHKYCFKCTSCAKRLDSNFLEHNEEPFCRQCHRNNFGTRDLRSGNLSPDKSVDLKLSTLPVLATDSEVDLMKQSSSPLTSEQTPPAAEEMDTVPSMAPAPRSPTSLTFGAPLRQQTTGNLFGQRAPLAPNFTGGMFARSGTAGRTHNTFGSSPTCPRCSKAVYFAEQVNAVGKKWHKACLNCSACRKRLDSFNLLEHDDEPYCKPCHVRNFGTRDLRSANLTPTTSA